VLLTLVTLLCKDPLLNEPGIMKEHPDMKRYNTIIEYANINVAIYALMSRKEGIFQPFFENFYSFMREYFNKNFDKILAFSKEKCVLFEETETEVSSVYQMRVRLDYKLLVKNLEDFKKQTF
jgi:hypothetical protein